jgi:nicotinate-nucleotide adenylyltransferase
MPPPPPFGDRRKRRVGVLGGSFNPAHDGHLHISREALKRLGLHQVWWLVSPQNPLKPERGMAPLDQRLQAARHMARDRRIVVTALEAQLGTTRTALTLKTLTRRYPAVEFVWLMGADNLAQMPRWWRWTRIFHTARVAVFDRSPYSYGALAGAAARRFAQARARRPATIRFRLLPAWTYVAIRRHPASATALRAKQEARRAPQESPRAKQSGKC